MAKRKKKTASRNAPARSFFSDAIGIGCVVVSVFVSASFISYQYVRSLGLAAGVAGAGENLMGPVGHVVGVLLFGGFGWCAVVPIAWLLYLGFQLWQPGSRDGVERAFFLFGVVGTILSTCSFSSILFSAPGGGSIGGFFAEPLTAFFGALGGTLFSATALIVSLCLIDRVGVGHGIQKIMEVLWSGLRYVAVEVPYAIFVVLQNLFGILAEGAVVLYEWCVASAKWLIDTVVWAGEWFVHSITSSAEWVSLKIADWREASSAEYEDEDEEYEDDEYEDDEEYEDEEDEEYEDEIEEEPVRAKKPKRAAKSKSKVKEVAELAHEEATHVVVRRRNTEQAGAKGEAKRKVRRPEKSKDPTYSTYEAPDLDLLTEPEISVTAETDKTLREKSKLIESKLQDFNIKGRITQVHPGPVITLFEFEPAPGVKVGRIASLQDDLAMSLRASSLRIIAPLPKKGTVGIEVPNRQREVVRLREVLESEEFGSGESSLTIGLGKDTYGEPIVADIAKMPHLLMAGATGTGKSVSINTILVSLLYRASPAELGLILIDPKILELSTYDNIPHLRVPVVTNPKQARAVLDWAVKEMDRRYRIMQKYGVRSIDGYNRLARGEKTAEEIKDDLQQNPQQVLLLKEENVVEPGFVEEPEDVEEGDEVKEKPIADKIEPLPKLVIVIDELADLMLSVGREVEDLITRLAQKARASGIHLIVATQRPSVDVITGLIKANFPARLSFRVSSRIDSRTILDSMGAEKLLGRGDMLLMEPGSMHLRRVHGAYVTDAEVKRVVTAVKKNCPPQYDEKIIAACDKALEEEIAVGGDTGAEEYDALYDKAVELVVAKGQASTSMVQRAFRIGYNRAARIVDMMERDGVIGPMDGVKPRQVLAPEVEALDPQ